MKMTSAKDDDEDIIIPDIDPAGEYENEGDSDDT